MEDIKQYIESGILELYVLDDLTREEKLEIENYAATYPEIKTELDEISKAMQRFAENNAVEPNENLKNTILNQLEYLDSKTDSTSFTQHKILSLQSTHKTNFYKYAFAASLALFLATGIALFNVYNRLQESKQQLVALQVQNQKFANQVNFKDDQLNQYRQRLNESSIKESNAVDTVNAINNSAQIIAKQKAELKSSKNEILALERSGKNHEKLLAIYSDPTSRFIKLNGVGSHKSQLLLAWNPDKKQLVINKKASTLPPNDQDHQYQLWAIVKLKPVSLGVFDVQKTDSIMESMTSVDRASAFAVTLEPRGGSEKPTMKEMVVMGLAHK